MSGIPVGITFLHPTRQNAYYRTGNHYRKPVSIKAVAPPLLVRNTYLDAIVNFFTFRLDLVTFEYMYIGIFIILFTVFMYVININSR